MLSAFFDLPGAKPGAKAAPKAPKAPKGRGRGRKAAAEPVPTETSTSHSVHARFEPLPPEKNVPRPVESSMRHEWQSSILEDDDGDLELFDDEDREMDALQDLDEEETREDDDDVSEPDFEPDSLDPIDESDMSSSFGTTDAALDGEDLDIRAFFQSRHRGPRHHRHAKQPAAVYSGPQLFCEDDEFD